MITMAMLSPLNSKGWLAATVTVETTLPSGSVIVPGEKSNVTSCVPPVLFSFTVAFPEKLTPRIPSNEIWPVAKKANVPAVEPFL